MSDLAPHSRDDLPYYPEPRHTCNCSPALCPVCSPVRSRLGIIRDYAATHDLSAKQVEALVRELPGGTADVVWLAEWRR